MFHSFFPRPKLFFTTAILWTIVCIAVWYTVGPEMGAALGMPPLGPDEKAPIGLAYFLSPDNLWFYLYFTIFVAIFGVTWQIIAKDHLWTAWSIWGSAFIIFIAYFAVQVSVALNNWRGPFFDLLQNALAKQGDVTARARHLKPATYLRDATDRSSGLSTSRAGNNRKGLKGRIDDCLLLGRSLELRHQ